MVRAISINLKVIYAFSSLGGGESASIIIPSSHVPLAHRGNYPNHTLLTL